MAAEKASLQEGLGRLREEGWLEESGHPDFDSLLALQAGDVTGREAETLARHLDSCLICRQVMADWAQFPDLEPPAGSPSLEEDRADEDWQVLRDRMVKEGLLPERKPAESKRESPANRRRIYQFQTILPWASASAVLAVVCVVLSVQLAREPDRNFDHAVWKEPVLRGPQAPRPFFFLEIIRSELAGAYDSYRLDIVAANGAVFRSYVGLEPNNEGTLTVLLDQRDLPPKGRRYVMKLFGLHGGVAKLLDEDSLDRYR